MTIVYCSSYDKFKLSGSVNSGGVIYLMLTQVVIILSFTGLALKKFTGLALKKILLLILSCTYDIKTFQVGINITGH